MTELLADAEGSTLLEAARRAAHVAGLRYAGSLPPVDAWALVRAGQAVLVDVRSSEERRFVGHVPGSEHIAWATGMGLTRNPAFLRELESRVDKAQVVVLLCRSGKRSAIAAEAAATIGFNHVFNVADGFEGERDARGRRGHLGGWRFHGLDWVQD